MIIPEHLTNLAPVFAAGVVNLAFFAGMGVFVTEIGRF